MDKRDFKEYIKIITKIYLLMLTIIGIPLNLIVALISSTSIENFSKNFISNIIIMFTSFTILLLFIYIGIFIVSILLKKKRQQESLFTEKYIRDLPKYFPPAIASFLLDLSLETITDYTATIAYLISKKYIELKENKIVVLNKNTNHLLSHEQYVLLCLTKKNTFNHDEFIKLVMKDAEDMKLIEKGKRKVHFIRNFGLSLLSFFILGILYNNIFTTGILNKIFGILGLISEVTIFAVIVYSIYLCIKYQKESYYRTKLGYIESLKWTGLKKFLKDFTLIKEKNIQDIITLDDYIPYAIALNEAKSIEKFIENNDSYRKLIYDNILSIHNK